MYGSVCMNAKYNRLIDTETWKFIKQTEAWYPADTVSSSIALQRETYDAMCREFHQGRPPGVRVSNSCVTHENLSVGVRRYVKQGLLSDQSVARIVYFHGGGFVVGGLDSHDDICSEFCDQTGFDVFSVDYRLAPEHDHPAAFDDSMAVVNQLSEQAATPLILCGDSAGGNLAAAVSHASRGRISNIIGQVLIYPGLGGNRKCGSYLEHADAPLLTTQDVDFYLRIRSGGKPNHQDATLAPLRDTTFSGLPPTVVFSAECDPLADDGLQYCSAINNADGKAKCFTETGLVHGYLRARSTVMRASDSFKRMVESLCMVGQGRWY